MTAGGGAVASSLQEFREVGFQRKAWSNCLDKESSSYESKRVLPASHCRLFTVVHKLVIAAARLLSERAPPFLICASICRRKVHTASNNNTFTDHQIPFTASCKCSDTDLPSAPLLKIAATCDDNRCMEEEESRLRDGEMKI